MDALNRALPRLPDVGGQRRIHGGWKLSKSSQERNDSFRHGDEPGQNSGGGECQRRSPVDSDLR